MTSIFKSLGLPDRPLFLAPLAGVSDHPFRRVAEQCGADLGYVEMIAATALVYNSARTLAMLTRHASERRLGVQITGPSAEETARAIAILNTYPFETIDINMGCPVKKVVKTGCGSAILRDPERVLRTLVLGRAATDKPLSCKIRLGWDHNSRNAVEIAQAAEAGGAAWITVHGRTRADDYSVAVDLDAIAEVKKSVRIPVVGNGNLLSAEDAAFMLRRTGVDGLMISRGALGHPWLFSLIKGERTSVGLDEWLGLVLTHLDYQAAAYGDAAGAAVCMRKHLLWYASGWPGSKKVREAINKTATLSEAGTLIKDFAKELRSQGVLVRAGGETETAQQRFNWDPKYDMDRKADRGVGDDQPPEALCASSASQVDLATSSLLT